MSEFADGYDPGGPDNDVQTSLLGVSGNRTSPNFTDEFRDKHGHHDKNAHSVAKRATIAQSDGSAARHNGGRGGNDRRGRGSAAAGAALNKTVTSPSRQGGTTTMNTAPLFWKDADPTEWRIYARGEAKAQISALLVGGGEAWLPLENHPLGYAQMLVERHHFSTAAVMEQVEALATLMDNDASHNMSGVGGRALLVPKKTRGVDGKFTLDHHFQGPWQKDMLKKVREAFPKMTWGFGLNEWKVPGLSIGLSALDFFKLKPWAQRHGLQFTALQSPHVTVIWLEVTGPAEDLPKVYKKERAEVEEKFAGRKFLWGEPDPSFVGHRCSLAIDGEVAATELETKRTSNHHVDYKVSLLPAKPKADKEKSDNLDEVIEEVTERHRSDVEERLTKAREQRRLDRKNAKKEARRLQRTGDAGMSTGGAAAESGATEGIPEDVSSSPSSSSEADDPDAYATTFAGAMQNVVKLLTTVRSTWEEKVNAVRDVARMVRDLGNMDHTLQDYSVSEFATAEDLHDFEKTYDFLVRKIAVHDADRMTREEFEAATEKAVLWKDAARGTHIPQATWLNPRPFRRSNNNGNNNNYRKTAAPAAATSSPPPASRRSSRT